MIQEKALMRKYLGNLVDSHKMSCLFDNNPEQKYVAYTMAPYDNNIICVSTNFTHLHKCVVLREKLSPDQFKSLIEYLKEYVVTCDDINSQCSNGFTPLHLACMNADNRSSNVIVELLLKTSNVDINIQDNNGCNALHSIFDISYSGHIYVDTLMLLIKYGIDLNLKNNIGKSALHLALDRWDYVFVKILIAAGTNVNLTDNGGQTPLHIIVDKWYDNMAICHKDLIELLISQGVDIYQENGEELCVATLVKLSFNEDYAQEMFELFGIDDYDPSELLDFLTHERCMKYRLAKGNFFELLKFTNIPTQIIEKYLDSDEKIYRFSTNIDLQEHLVDNSDKKNVG